MQTRAVTGSEYYSMTGAAAHGTDPPVDVQPAEGVAGGLEGHEHHPALVGDALLLGVHAGVVEDAAEVAAAARADDERADPLGRVQLAGLVHGRELLVVVLVR